VPCCSSWDVTDWPWGLGAGGAQSAVRGPFFFSTQVCMRSRRDFRKNKSGPRRRPRPPRPVAPPVLGSLVRRVCVWGAEGLPSTRNWPFARAFAPVAPVTHQPAPGDTQGNVIRQVAGAVVLGGGAAPAPPLAGSGRSCASSIRAPKKNARCPGLRALRAKAWP
jgi:hypothetical protein